MNSRSPIFWLLAIFSTYRLASLLSKDEGPHLPISILSLGDAQQTGVFETLRVRLGVYDYGPDGRPETNLARGLSCPLCTGVYFAALVLLLLQLPYRWGHWFVFWTGIAGAQVFLENLTSDNALQEAIEEVADSLEEQVEH